jgi:predicted amidohydrolase
MKLSVATCQFPLSLDIQGNFEHIQRQMVSAKEQDADVAHFPEASLSGYAGTDFPSFEGFDWALLKTCSREVLRLAGELHIWTIFGSAHKLSGNNKPHNCLYIINREGEIVDRYDKLFCAGDPSASSGDLAHYSPGNHFSVFGIDGIQCGALICHDYRYPELYREYKRRGVQLMFHSFHAGHIDADRFQAMQDQVGSENHPLNPATTIPGITQPAAMHVAAANNYMWISCPNSSARESCWPSFFVRPDGVVTGQVPLHKTGILLSKIDTDQNYYDSTVAWRDRAMNGVFHSGTIVQDPRSERRKTL